MKTASKKLFGSIAVLMVAVALAITSTYAWFTMSSTPSVEGLDLSATTSSGLLISIVDPDTGEAEFYKASLTSGDVTSHYPLDAIKLQDVTSADGKTFTKADSTSAADTAYYSFIVSFQSSTSQKIYLSELNNSVATKTAGTLPKAKAWTTETEKYGKAITEGQDISAEAKDAARVSFVKGSFVDSDFTATTANVWEPNPNTGFKNNDFGKNLAVDYWNHINESNKFTQVPDYITELTKIAKPLSAYNTAGTELLTLTGSAGNFTGMLKINIWLEGWDGDCLKSVLGDILTVNLQFEGVEVV